MVSFKEHGRIGRRKAPDQTIDNALRVRAAIDVISKKDERNRQIGASFLVALDDAQQGLKEVQTPMNVAHGVQPGSIWRDWLFPIARPEYQVVSFGAASFCQPKLQARQRLVAQFRRFLLSVIKDGEATAFW